MNETKIKALDQQRWIVLAAVCLVNLCLGSIYAWSVFSSGMAAWFASKGLDITPASMAIVYTIANAVGPITMISGGWFNDRFGPKMVIMVGGIMFGAGMIASGFATSLGYLIVTYGLISGLGLGMAYGATISTAQKWFPDKRGLIGGITTAVYGMSSVILPPIVTAIVAASNAANAFKIIGAVFLVVVVGSSFFVRQCPAGYIPSGFKAPAGAGKAVNMDWKQMIATPVFYCMLVMLTCGAFTGMMIISQASSMAQNMIGMSAAAAGIAVSTLALFNAAGRIAAGWISDKIGRVNTLAAACLLAIGGLALLYVCKEGSIALFYGGISAVGMSFGSFMGVYPGFTVDQFGPKYNSVNYGIMFIGFALAGYFGPQIMGKMYAASGQYQNAFLAAMGLSALGILLTFVYRALRKKA